MTRTNPRQPLWQRVKEEADYKTLGSAHDRQKLSTLADGARWEHGADAEKLATYAARHAAAQPAYDAAAARYAADDGADDGRFAELPRIAKDVPRTFGGERRALAGHGTSSLASAPMRDSPACTLRAVWDTARRPDAPVRRPRPARRRRSLQQLRGAFMATPSCSPRRRRRGNRDRGRPMRQRLPTTIGAVAARRRRSSTRRSMPGQPGGLPVDPKTRSFEGQAAGP